MPKTKEKKPEKLVEKEVAGDAPENQDKTFLHFLRLVIVAGVLLVFGLIFVAWGTYSEGWQNNFVDSIYKVAPYPAASVGYNHWITLNEFNENVKAMRRFLESKEASYGGGNFDFSTPEGLKRLSIIKKNILDQLIEDKIVEIIARDQGINVSKGELADTTQKVLSQEGKESDNVTELNYLYGWGPDDFGENVIRNMMFRERLEDKLNQSGELTKEIKSRVDLISQKLASGEDFSELAKTYSDSPSKQYGGLLPVFSRDEATSEITSAAFRLNVGEISQPIESASGWSFIKVERKFQEDGKDKIEIRNILINKLTFKDWLANKKKDFKILVFMKPYYWHTQMGKLYFKDDGLNQVEDQMMRTYLNEKNQEADFIINASKTPPTNK